ncbi:hypothetical protein QM806_39960 [Rhodococcus sp. IEGM 1351]|nr:hypothetical protein [Rhodococcus sp. IEGM 1351]
MMQRRSTQRQGLSVDDLRDRLPARFYHADLSQAKPFCGLDEYAVDLDDWLRVEMGLPQRDGVRYHPMTIALMGDLDVATISDWFRCSMIGATGTTIDDLSERLSGYGDAFQRGAVPPPKQI